MLRSLLSRFLDDSANRHASRTARSRRPARGRCLKLEPLENRYLMASVGLKTAVIDFGGETFSAAEMRDGGWDTWNGSNSGSGAVSVNSFNSLFTNSRPQLDMNADGIVNGTDATLAGLLIMARVRADYAPYNINIVAGNIRDSISRLSDSLVGDVFVSVTGSANTIDTARFTSGIYGVAPVDAGNVNDDIAFVFGRNIVDAALSAASMINRMARTISHEMGHTFGLSHITDTSGDAVSHHLMNAPNGGIDPRDFARDFGFQDLWYNTTAGAQNSHSNLSTSTVLGASPNAWMAVLKPGELTVVGTETADVIGVSQNSAGTSWTVTGAGASVTMTLSSVDTTSFNPFDAPLNRILVYARGGDDTVTIGTNILVDTQISGGEGSDTIYGGGGRDALFGNGGTDYLYGRGGNDILVGGKGTDYLYGGRGNDTLIGCDAFMGLVNDYTRDYLYGEEDADTIYNFRDDFLRAEDTMTTDLLDTIVWGAM